MAEKIFMADNFVMAEKTFFKNYTVSMDIKIEMKLEVDPIHDIMKHQVVNFAMLTMGSRIKVLPF
jgi:hypothetical protein